MYILLIKHKLLAYLGVIREIHFTFLKLIYKV